MAAESSVKETIVRRNRPGTKSEDMYGWPEQDFNDMETVLAGTDISGVRIILYVKTSYWYSKL